MPKLASPREMNSTGEILSTDAGYFKEHTRLQIVLLILFVVASVARIVSTYSVFSQTWDEPVHVASGMEWLQQGTYEYEVLHPPLARIAEAIGPYLSGIRLSSHDLHPMLLVEGGNAIFASGGNYLHNLILARLGVLPFFFLCVGTVWYWTQRVFDSWTAVAAVGLFTTLPPILGHAALATTDLPITATFALALFSFTNWLERPTTRQTFVLGIAVGLAILSKFTALLFLPVCCGAVLLCWLFASKVTVCDRYPDIMLRFKQFGLAALVCGALIFTCYRFSSHPATGPDQRPHLFLDHLFGDRGRWHDTAYQAVETVRIPAPEFFHGVVQARGRLAYPTNMYLLGQVQTHGWWYFFLVALVVKTPIAFLILMIIGTLGAIGKWKKTERDWQILVPSTSALALLSCVCLLTKFNIGLRHILPIYPLLSMLAGFGITELWRNIRVLSLGRILAGGLATWMLASTARAQPDNLAYFNEFAGDHPESILVDSDLDWGQDLLRLNAALHARGISHFAIAYNGSADLSRMNLPPFEILAPCIRTTGWIAVSLLDLQMSKPSIGCGGFSWLEAYRPVMLIGKSIRLYWVSNAEGTSNSIGTEKR
jgi:4-amino-4-deoxy-L-arabinose transferase-like glycosyltransferase